MSLPDLALRLLLVAITAAIISLASTPSHAHDEGWAVDPAAEEAEHRPSAQADPHHHGAADPGCGQAGHCSSAQLLPDLNAYGPIRSGGATWCAPCDRDATSSRPEVSIPPPRRA